MIEKSWISEWGRMLVGGLILLASLGVAIYSGVTSIDLYTALGISIGAIIGLFVFMEDTFS